MGEIAARASVETKALIQYIIDGIEDKGYRKTVLYGAKTIRELKDKLDAYAEMYGKVKSSVKVSENKKKPLNIENRDAKRDGKRCYNCGASDHISALCSSKGQGPKCFRCNKHGHIAAKCTEDANADKKRNCNIIQSNTGKRRKDVIIRDVKVSAVIDSGSDLSLISEEQYEQIGSPIRGNRKIEFRGAGPGTNTTLGDIQTKICIDMEVYDITMHVVSNDIIPCGIIIGTDFLNIVDVRIRKGVVSISKIENEFTKVPEVCKIDTRN